MCVTLEKFVPLQHTELLKSWLEQPHVCKWWLDPPQQLSICLAREKTGSDHRLIAIDGRPVGYIRWEPFHSRDLAPYADINVPEGAVDLDILIGDPDDIGRGVGPSALRQLEELLSEAGEIAFLMLAVSIDNHSAINAYQKCQFIKVVEFDGGKYGPSQLMSRSIQ